MNVSSPLTAPGAPQGTGGRAHLDRRVLARWLDSDHVVDGRGGVASWHNPDHPGYEYPEAAGLWLSWAAWRAETGQATPADARVRAVAGRAAGLMERTGAVGRDGRLYLFDTCVVLDALVRARRAGLIPSMPDLGRVKEMLDRFLRSPCPVVGGGDPDDRWSSTWGPHMLRAAGLLARAGRGHGDAELTGHASTLSARVRDGDARVSLVHAMAYAVEGKVLLDALDEAPSARAASAAARKLVQLQRTDGGVPARTDGSGPSRADATAQAVRIWSLLEPEAFASSIGRALAFLARHQQATGGVEYDSSSADLNTWATLFTDQAAHGARHGTKATAWI